MACALPLRAIVLINGRRSSVVGRRLYFVVIVVDDDIIFYLINGILCRMHAHSTTIALHELNRVMLREKL